MRVGSEGEALRRTLPYHTSPCLPSTSLVLFVSLVSTPIWRAFSSANMAVRPYLSRAEVWLANGNFRAAFKFPSDFHPSAFIKWYPGHMAKGNCYY